MAAITICSDFGAQENKVCFLDLGYVSTLWPPSGDGHQVGFVADPEQVLEESSSCGFLVRCGSLSQHTVSVNPESHVMLTPRV